MHVNYTDPRANPHPESVHKTVLFISQTESILKHKAAKKGILNSKGVKES